MEAIIIGYTVAIIVLIICSAFFSMTETAFTSVSRVKLKKLANEGNKKAARSIKILDNYDRFLTTILIGNNLVNIAGTSLATTVFAILLGAETGAIATTVVMTLALLIFSEITPKVLAKKYPEKIVMAVCTAVYYIMLILSPLSWLFSKLTNLIGSDDGPQITEEEFEVMIDEIQSEGVLEETEGKLLKSALKFDDVKVVDVCVHRTEIVAIDVDREIKDLEEMFIETGYSIIALYEETIDNIIGEAYAKTYFMRKSEGGDFAIRDVMAPVKYIPETVSAADALNGMQKSRMHLAVVLDSHGGTRGIVTIVGLLNVLLGEIWDSDDGSSGDVRATTTGCYVIKGTASLDDVTEKTGVTISRDGFKDPTITGLVMYRLQRVPIVGDIVELDKATITVDSVEDHCVKECTLVVKNASLEDDAEDVATLLDRLRVLKSEKEEDSQEVDSVLERLRARRREALERIKEESLIEKLKV